MIKKTIVISLILLISTMSYAFDIAFVPFDKALKSGELVFIGFVDSVSVIDKTTGKIKAKANILVEECLIGESCQKGEMVSLNYFAQVSVGTSLPVKFPVGKQVLLVLKSNKRESTYDFDSDVNGGTDFSFVCDAFPYSMIDVHSKFNCKDSMTGKEIKNLTFNEIKRILRGYW